MMFSIADAPVVTFVAVAGLATLIILLPAASQPQQLTPRALLEAQLRRVEARMTLSGTTAVHRRYLVSQRSSIVRQLKNMEK